MRRPKTATARRNRDDLARHPCALRGHVPLRGNRSRAACRSIPSACGITSSNARRARNASRGWSSIPSACSSPSSSSRTSPNIVALLLATRTLVASFGSAGYFISIAVAIPVHLFLLGVLPKSLFRRFPLRTLAALAGILENVSLLLWPILEFGRRIGGIFLPRRDSNRRRLFAAREELKQVAVQSEREGSLTASERAMIHNVVDYRNVRARDVMVPLAKCITLEPEASIEQVLELSNSTGADRFPVVSKNGQAVGLVNVLDILLDPTRSASLARYTRRIITATDNESAYRIIRRLRAARLGLAAVVDRQKKLVGIATDEELIKRLVQSA